MQWLCYCFAGPPGAEREPGDSSNMTDFWFCEVQSRRRKCRSLVRIWCDLQKKRSFTKISRVFPAKIKWSPKKRKKKVFIEIWRFFPANLKVFGLHMLISQCHFLEGHRPPKVHRPGGHCFPLPLPPSRRPCCFGLSPNKLWHHYEVVIVNYYNFWSKKSFHRLYELLFIDTDVQCICHDKTLI